MYYFWALPGRRKSIGWRSFSGISMEVISDLLWRKVAIGTLKKLSIHMFTRYEHAPATCLRISDGPPCDPFDLGSGASSTSRERARTLESMCCSAFGLSERLPSSWWSRMLTTRNDCKLQDKDVGDVIVLPHRWKCHSVDRSARTTQVRAKGARVFVDFLVMVLFIGGKCKLACLEYGLKVILIIARFEEVERWHWTHVGAA